VLFQDNLVSHPSLNTIPTKLGASRPTGPAIPDAINGAILSGAWNLALQASGARFSTILGLGCNAPELLHNSSTTGQRAGTIILPIGHYTVYWARVGIAINLLYEPIFAWTGGSTMLSVNENVPDLCLQTSTT
jgi:hypothetical protein